MPDITVNVRVVGAQQAAEQLTNLGSAAGTAGSKAATGSGGISRFGSSASSAAIGAFALVNGAQGIQDSFDNVAKSDLALSRAHAKTESASIALKKAQEAWNKSLQDTNKTVDTGSGEIGTLREHVISYNAATGQARVQTTSTNGEVKTITKNIKENSTAYDNLVQKQDAYNNASEREQLQAVDTSKVHQRLGTTIAGNAFQMGLGVAAIAPFLKSLFGLGGAGAAAAEGSEAAAAGVGEVGAAAGGGSLALPILAGAAIATGATMVLMKTNFLGARDAIGGTANAVQTADKSMKPLGLTVDGLMKKVGILPDPFNTANAEIKTGTAGISQQINHMGVVAGQGIDFVVKGFNQFTKQIQSGDLGGAFDTMIGGIQTGFDKLKGIATNLLNKHIIPDLLVIGHAEVNWIMTNIWPKLEMIYNNLKQTWGAVAFYYKAVMDWEAENVWPLIGTAYADLRAFWGNVVTAYNATVNWITNNVWPALGTAYAAQRALWGNVAIAYNATVNWITKNFWSSIAAAYADLRAFWGNVAIAYNATVNWLTKNAWPALATAYTDLRNTWGNVITSYNATVNWLAKNVWPSLTAAFADLRSLWGNVSTSYNAAIKFLNTYEWPTIDDAYKALKNLWGNVETSYNAAIKFLPTFSWPDIKSAIANWLHLQQGGSTIAGPSALSELELAVKRGIAEVEALNAARGPTVGSLGGGTSTAPLSGYQSGPGPSPPISGSSGSGLPYQNSPVTTQPNLNVGGPYVIAGHDATYNQNTGVYEERNTGMPLKQAALGGSFIVDRPMTFGNIMVGEGNKPELLTVVPLQGGSGLLNVTPLTGVHAPPSMQRHGFANGGTALVHRDVGSRLGSFLSSYSSTIHDFEKQTTAEGRSSINDPDKLYALIEKLTRLIGQSNLGSGKMFSANLNVDGQRMSSVVQKHIGQHSYGDR